MHISVACKHYLDCTLTHSCTHYFKYFFFVSPKQTHQGCYNTRILYKKQLFSVYKDCPSQKKQCFLWLRSWKILESILENSFFMDCNKILILLLYFFRYKINTTCLLLSRFPTCHVTCGGLTMLAWFELLSRCFTSHFTKNTWVAQVFFTHINEIIQIFG